MIQLHPAGAGLRRTDYRICTIELRLTSANAHFQAHLTNHQSPITNHQSPITNHQSPIINHQSSIINHQSSIINHQSSIINHQSFFRHQTPSITDHNQ